jgi:hypothetical protein
MDEDATGGPPKALLIILRAVVASTLGLFKAGCNTTNERTCYLGRSIHRRNRARRFDQANGNRTIRNPQLLTMSDARVATDSASVDASPSGLSLKTLLPSFKAATAGKINTGRMKTS